MAGALRHTTTTITKGSTVNTTVITREPADYGPGPFSRHTFVASKYKVDEAGALHVYPDHDGPEGNLAAFAPGSWHSVVRGDVYTEAGTNEVPQ